MDAEPVLHRNCGGRKGVIGRRGRQHDQVDRLGVKPRMMQRRARSLDRQVRGELALGGDVALADARALHDPLVGRINAARQFGIGQNPLRQI